MKAHFRKDAIEEQDREGIFLVLNPTGQVFPTNEQVRENMLAILEFLKKEKNKICERWALPVAEKVKVPEEFRQSIFGNGFVSEYSLSSSATPEQQLLVEEKNNTTKKYDYKYPYGQYFCGNDIDFLEDLFAELDQCDGNDGIFAPVEFYDVCQNSGCENPATFFTADGIGGYELFQLENNMCFCSDCALQKQRPPLMKQTLSVVLLSLTSYGGLGTEAVVEIILDYLECPFQLYRIPFSVGVAGNPSEKTEETIEEPNEVEEQDEEPEEEESENPTQRTSVYIDWVKFLTLNLVEDSVQWFINCNLDSPFYGHILVWGHQGELRISDDTNIHQFEKDFFNTINCQKV